MLLRRSAALALASALLIALTAVASLLPVPYVVYTPGPITDTLGVNGGAPLIAIDGRRTYPSAGRLALTTVYVTGPARRMDLGTALGGWLDPDVAVVPREVVYPDGATEAEVEQENAEEMVRSQVDATAAALRELDIPVPARVVVGAVVEDAPALGRLRAGDVLRSVDGTPATTPEQVRDLVRRHRPGETVVFDIVRAGAPRRVEVTTAAAPDEPDTAVVGIVPDEGYDFPFEVDISIEKVGGPSAGLMFALGIVDKLTPEDLTGGTYVAGTGTIDGEGRVGPVGGIQQKVAAAREAEAKVFLTPARNCALAARADHDGVRLVRVETLAGARAALDALRAGDAAGVPGCTS